MRILYLRTYFNFNLKAGGSVGHTAGVINALAKKVDIDVVSNDHLPEVKIPVRIIKPFRVKLGLLNNILEIIYNIKLNKILKSEIPSYDAIYHRYTGNSYIASAFAKQYDVPLILEFNSSVVWSLKNWDIKQKFPKNIIRFLFNRLIRLPYTAMIEKYNLKYSRVIVVVSEVMKNNLVNMGVDENKILVNPNGVDPEMFSPRISGERIRKKYNLEHLLVFGFIGTFGQWHGITELVRAVNIFYHQYPGNLEKSHFLLMGDGILMPEVKKILSSSDYKNNVTLTGLVPIGTRGNRLPG
jgi:glycosyltransferase involved in cell wall biosynthesis